MCTAREQVEYERSRFRIEFARWFVGDDHFGIICESDCEPGPGRFTAGKLRRTRPGTVGDAEFIEQCPNRCGGFPRRKALGDCDVAFDTEMVEQIVGLKQHSYMSCSDARAFGLGTP